MAVQADGLRDVVDEIWIDSSPGMDRVLFLAAGRAVEIWHEFAHAPTRVGEVHRLRIDQIFAEQNRATARLEDGTLVSLRLTQRDKAAAGQLVDATIIAAPRQQKPHQAIMGARLAGSFIVLLPEASGIKASRTLEPDQAAALALELAEKLPEGFGIVLRRRSAGVPISEIAGELARLLALWRSGVNDKCSTGLLHAGGTLADKACFHATGGVLRFVGKALSAGQFDEAYEVAVQAASEQPIILPGGGKVWIEATQALTAVDLDSAGGSLASLFAEAPAVIATRLRLRGVSGLVAIDVPRASPAAAKSFTKALDRAFASDPRHPEILGRSRGGLTECRIAHGRPALADLLADRVALDALLGLRRIHNDPRLVNPQMTVSHAVAGWLAGPGAAALASLDRHVRLVVTSEAAHESIQEQE